MIATRYLGLALALVLLNACDPVEPIPPKSPPAPPAPVVSAPVAAAKFTPERPLDKVEKPTKPVVKKPQEALVVTLKPRPVPSVSKAAKEPLPKAKLDLHLPSDLVEKMEPGESVDETISKSLLPPLFVEKPPAQSPFQLNGRLITNDREQDYWQSVEGAELQFEFKH